MPSAVLESSQRPRTRAWVKAQAARSQAVQVAQSSRKPRERAAKSAAKQRLIRSTRKETSQSVRSTVKKGSEQTGPRRKKQPPRPKPSKSIKRRPCRTARPKSKKGAEQPEQPPKHDNTVVGVPRWLQRVQSVSPERALEEHNLYTARIPGVASSRSENMDSGTTSRETGENESTAKGIGLKISSKISLNKLKYRHVDRDTSEDEKLPYLRSILKTSLPERSMGEIPELEAIVLKFAEQIRNRASESCWAHIDEFSLKFDEGKTRMHYPIINPAYFDNHVKKCLSKNEAVLQRTVMMSIFHHYWLGDMFDWNTEGQWAQPDTSRLPSTKDDLITSPRPDLAISFASRSFAGEEDDSDPMPTDLEKVISPDDPSKCFPFLLVEVKKARKDLDEALLTNLHSASQALYNMYQWMAPARMEKDFLEHVRVFSFALNAQDFSVRVHRAISLSNGTLKFCFDELLPMTRYTRDVVCLLVDGILNKYAAIELHPKLLSAFREVSSQERDRVQSKRKANPAASRGPKRMRKSDEANHTGQSFEMADLHT